MQHLQGQIFGLAHSEPFALSPGEYRCINLRLSAPPEPLLEGRVRDRDGKAVGSASLTLETEASGAQVAMARSDAAGIFLFPAAPPGLYRLRVAAPGFHHHSLALQLPLERVEVELAATGPQLGAVIGRVLGPDGAALPSPVLVTLMSAAGRTLDRQPPTAEGVFAFSNLDPGAYRIEVRAEGLMTVMADFALAQGEVVTLRLPLLPLADPA